MWLFGRYINTFQTFCRYAQERTLLQNRKTHKGKAFVLTIARVTTNAVFADWEMHQLGIECKHGALDV